MLPHPTAIVLSLALALLLGAPAASWAEHPRRVRPKPAHTILEAYDDPSTLVVKFREGTRVRRRGADLAGTAGFDRAALRRALGGIPPSTLKRLFPRAEQELDAERARGQARSGRALADLNLYYRLPVPAEVDAGRLCDALNALPFVELASPAARPAPAPVDLFPATPGIAVEQGYLAAPPHGIGALDPVRVPGADGLGLVAADIEFSWVLDHEDLEFDGSALLGIGTPFDPDDDGGDHGTAVLGIISALPNEYGIDGIAPGAGIFAVPASTLESGFDVARAISGATAALLPGDVILIELQICSCGCNGGERLGPVEWEQANFDAIATATSLGIHVVEAAGNAGLDLDAAICNGLFNRGFRDSGAILVGAGDGSRSRLAFSNFGSRVDVQAWGDFVVTLGFGDRFDPGDPRQRYTRDFGGTSSATAIVAGAALAVQGERIARGDGLLTPAALRQLLVSTGTPQDSCDGANQQIGPLPDLPAAIGIAACADGLDNDGDGFIDHPEDPGCESATDPVEFELPRGCRDGLDNDGDGLVDHPADPDCSDADDPTEFRLRSGDVLLVDSYGFRDRTATGELLRVDPVTGFPTRLFAGGAFVDPTGIAVAEDGTIWIPDFSTGVLIALPPEGEDQTVVSACFEGPWGVALPPGNTAYVTETNRGAIIAVDRTTGAQTVVASGGNLVSPRGIAIDDRGDLIVADSGFNQILRVNPTTGAQTLVSSGAGFVNVRGLAIGGDGAIYVADFGGGAIVRVSPVDGSKTFVATGGQLARPRNVAFDGLGRLWVAEEDGLDGAGSVLRIDLATPDDGRGGNQTVIASGGDFVDPFAIAFVPEADATLGRWLAILGIGVLARCRRPRRATRAQASGTGFACRNSRA